MNDIKLFQLDEDESGKCERLRKVTNETGCQSKKERDNTNSSAETEKR